jgi:hypothetical protein
MRPLILAVAYVLAATSASLAQGGFNPGTVVSNTYDMLETRGCDQSFGFSPSGCNYGRVAPNAQNQRYGTAAGRPYKPRAAAPNRPAGWAD